ncbi:hypothetical protein FHS00_003333 [Limimaricola variabilis]|uniref:Uncharacterized protein n=1 Tax=Limimaricola variabilis TaxID=1492771 RepID=A0ABR6HTD4_9RHOB|nr:hypothetical protein [Limimaricola variabilis]MBB3713726.1 hypothetical protein [Limimaricola variabilis]
MTEKRKLSEALESAKERGRAWPGEMLADPEMLTEEQMAQRLGVSPAEIKGLRRQHRVLALNLLGETRYPAFQTGPNGMILPCLDQIIARLNGQFLEAYRLLMSKTHDGTNRRLHELLATGEADKVLGEADAWQSGAFT